MKQGTLILALSPGTRLTGVAWFRDGELADWEVQGFKGPWNRAKQKKIARYLKSLLEGSDTTNIAVRLPATVSPSLQWMLDEVREQAAHQRIRVQGYPLFLLKKAYDVTALNRERLRAVILEAEPDLAATLPRSFHHKEYYSRMIEAVGVGRACYQQFSPDMS